MTQADEILRMIETVDQSDKENLDEIDARVFCFLLDREFSCIEGNGRWVRFTDGHKTFNASVSYTRSRDAIKAIRPEGWFSGAEPNFEDQGMYCGLYFQGHAQNDSKLIAHATQFKMMATEELAELHAVIQAIEYERGNK
jgi:hypothetical protein